MAKKRASKSPNKPGTASFRVPDKKSPKPTSRRNPARRKRA